MKPKSRKFGKHTFKYKYVDSDDPNSPDHNGFVLLEQNKIFISNQPDSPIERVIIHEDLHAVLYSYGIRDLDRHFEHAIIEAISDYICDYYQPKKP